MTKLPAKRLKAWSFSRLRRWEECPKRAKYGYLDRLPEPKGPALERGIRVHEGTERFLIGQRRDLLPELEFFADDLKTLKKRGAVAEEEWAFTSKWKATGWAATNAWLRMKTDVHYQEDIALTIIDFKTGREYPEHTDQLELYGVGGVAMGLADPNGTVTVEAWYLDSGEIISTEYDFDYLVERQGHWERRARPMLTDTEFKATPSRWACRFCPFGKSKGGPCQDEHG